MKILHLLYSRNFAGTEQMVLTLARAQTEFEKCEVFIAVKNGGILKQKYRDAGLNILDIPINGFFAKWRIAAWARKNKIEIIHTHLTGATRMGVSIHKQTGIPLAAHLHLTKDSPAYRDAAQAGRLIAISEHVARFYREKAGIPPERIRVIPNATLALNDPLANTPREELATRIRLEYNLPLQTRLLVFPGRISPEKGHEILLQAMPGILEKHPATHVFIVGNLQQKPRYAAKLKKICAQLKIDANIHFTGFLPDALRFIRAAEAQLVLSENEPFGLVLLEAMAMGTPVIAASTGAIPDILENGTLGTLIPYGDFATLTRTVSDLLDTPAPYQAKAGEARARAQELYTPEILARKTLLTYQELATSPRTTRL